MKTDKIIDQLYKYLILFLAGGNLYGFIEVVSRGYTHWTMLFVGGISFIFLGLINEIISWEMPLIEQMIIGSVVITFLEFITGCVVNLWLGWNVWDYSDVEFNILGQICLKYSMYWFFLSAVGIILDDYLRYWMFSEDKPKYQII